MTRIIARVSPDRNWIEFKGVSAHAREVVMCLRVVAPANATIRVSDGVVCVPVAQAQYYLDLPSLTVEYGSDVARFLANRTGGTGADSVDRFRNLLRADIENLRASVADSRLLHLLDDHQVRNVAAMVLNDSPGACLFDEQGTGKTLSVVAAFDLLVERQQADILVVIAPKSMVGEWGTEIRRFTRDLYRVETLDGSRRSKSMALDSGAEVFIGNYESLVALPDAYRLLCSRHRTVLVADESFNVKNPEARRTGALADLREWCVKAFALCGTPAPNDAADVVAQVSFVDFGRAFSAVRLPEDPSARRDAVRSVIETSVVYTRNLKSVVLPNLPGRVYTDVEVALAPRQRELYLRVAGKLAEDLSSLSDESFRAEYTNYLARRAALLRACSDPTGVDPGHLELPAKFEALDSLLARWTDTGEKVVVWSFYRATLDRLHKRFGHLGVARVDGSIGDVAARRAAVRDFQESRNVRIFLANPAAAGAGITLHAARVAVYESMSNQAAHYLQSLDRIHRRGQTRDVEYVTLFCAGTIEEDEYRRLHRKAALQADLLGDPEPDRMTRTVMLDELVTSLARLGRM